MTIPKPRPDPTPEERSCVKAKFQTFITEVQAKQQAEEIAKGRKKRDMARHDSYWGTSTRTDAQIARALGYTVGDGDGRDD